MFAVVQVGSAQFKVAEGDVIETQRVKSEEGKEITLDKVLLFAKGSDVRMGQPYIKDVKVKALVVDHGLGNKVIAFKYRRRKDSSSKRGHRSQLTTLQIKKIEI